MCHIVSQFQYVWCRLSNYLRGQNVRESSFCVSLLHPDCLGLLAMLSLGQSFVFFYGHHHDHRAPMLRYSHGFNTGEIDKPAEAILGILCR